MQLKRIGHTPFRILASLGLLVISGCKTPATLSHADAIKMATDYALRLGKQVEQYEVKSVRRSGEDVRVFFVKKTQFDPVSHRPLLEFDAFLTILINVKTHQIELIEGI